MKDNISPEEKLLRLIKQDKKPKAHHLPTQDIDAIKKTASNISYLKPEIKNSRHSLAQRYLTPYHIQKLMLVLIIISFLYLIASFIYPWTSLKNIKLPAMLDEKITEAKPEVKPYEFFLEPVKNRQIFITPSNPTTQTIGTPGATLNTDLIKDINLVGIISGESPQAIIEDKKTQKAFYLSKGQFIGEFQVEDIQEGKIILNYQGQRYELYL